MGTLTSRNKSARLVSRHIQQLLALTRGISNSSRTALQSIDLLQTYRGLVELGRIRSDDNQVRVVMQLRRLQRELRDYAPPALTSHYLSRLHDTTAQVQPWWSRTTEDEETTDLDQKALVRVKTHAEDLAELTTPKGLLLTGPPGSGKSFLVDLWYNAVPTAYKARKHYNELVLELYRGVWEETQHRMRSLASSDESHITAPAPQPWTKSVREQWRTLVSTGSLPIKWTHRMDPHFRTSSYSTQPTIAFVVARRLLLRHWLLVFDEIQLLDVSSATLLADVLSWYWRMGGVIVGTSNKVPDDLYKNGVQRDRLEPFVEALKVRCPVVSLSTEVDWREFRASQSTDSRKTWYIVGDEEAFIRSINDAVGSDAPSPQTLLVFGRRLYVPWSTQDACKFSFQELCEESLGPADYLTITSIFRTVIITSIPVLRLSSKNQARRFISLIDALYEARCRLICQAESDPQHLFFPDAIEEEAKQNVADNIDVLLAESVGETRDVYRPNVSSYDAPKMNEAPSDVAQAMPNTAIALETLSIFSGKDEQFAFKRALSRLIEMTSESYGREEQWTPLPDAARKWERSSVIDGVPRRTTTGTSYSAAQSIHTPPDDFTAEAAYTNLERADTSQRPVAPQLHEEHMWGVREDWVKRAGTWGRGAVVHSDK
ncbi:AFG1-like ATPase-domain-containing protein [Irpex rosettiformis]|uniref:AFG1-like ATPase-domain-containing protein n=1 Tax=Irpex rosettiformis TaxID=378272 RepID=A0ACB8TSR9_9APHY|nr:AFG1-like ATPase-domain-containing protein [Irpex rosettiformis]